MNDSIVFFLVLSSILNIALLIWSIKSHKELKSLLHKSNIDELTGIYNRSAFIPKINTFLSKQEKLMSSALLLIDLDHFKIINDTLGHLVGDEVLKELSTQMKILFGDCIIGRWGGDEFIAFIKDTSNIDTVIDKASILCKSMNRPFSNSEYSQTTSISIGIVFSDTGDTFYTLLQRADQALYTVKNKGRNNFYIYDKASDNPYT